MYAGARDISKACFGVARWAVPWCRTLASVFHPFQPVWVGGRTSLNASAGTAKLIDQGVTALIKDLKQRDMLKDTLIVFASEFGRTPMAQGNGRDHHIKGFSVWLAGGGIKGGVTHGSTDDLGYNAVEGVVSVHDLHATMMHVLGIDHEKMTVSFQGRDFRLTDISGIPVQALLV